MVDGLPGGLPIGPFVSLLASREAWVKNEASSGVPMAHGARTLLVGMVSRLINTVCESVYPSSIVGVFINSIFVRNVRRKSRIEVAPLFVCCIHLFHPGDKSQSPLTALAPYISPLTFIILTPYPGALAHVVKGETCLRARVERANPRVWGERWRWHRGVLCTSRGVGAVRKNPEVRARKRNIQT